MKPDATWGSIALLVKLFVEEKLVWFFKRTHYWTTLLAAVLLIWNIVGLWISPTYAPPYMCIAICLLITLMVTVLLVYDSRLFELRDDALYKTWKWTFGSTFILNICIWIAAGISFAGDSIYWKVTDNSGRVLETAVYPSDVWSFGYNATDPIKLDLAPTFGAFRWQKTVSVPIVMNGQTCEVQYDVNLACPVTYNNVAELDAHMIDDETIAAVVRDYLPAIFTEARRNQANCGAGNFVEITSSFDPKSVNPRIHWSKAEFAFRYRFKPIV